MVGGTITSAEHETITGVEPPAGLRGRARGPEVRGEAPSPAAESIFVIGCPTEPANLASFQKCPFELRYTQQSPHRYGNLHAIWDHTVLPATRQR